MQTFAYTRADNLSAALKSLETEPDAQIIAGGMSLIPALKLRLTSAAHLIDISGIPELTSISMGNEQIIVGSMVTHDAIESSQEIRATLPVLAQVAGSIGDPMVRNRGTLGGSLANADPAADYAAVVLGLNATILTNRREIQAENFFTGLFQTALLPNEIITGVKFPTPLRAGYAKVRQQASRFAVVGVFVAQFKDGVRVAVTGAAQNVFRQRNFEAALAKNFDAGAVANLSVDAKDLTSDMHADADYRANLIKHLAQKALTACNARS